MTEYLTESVREAIAEAERARARRRGRMRVVDGDRSVPVLRSWPAGFAVEAARAGRLRGLVDLYEGSRHVCRCLIVTSRDEGGERLFEFKRSTPATDRAPVDFERAGHAPRGLLAGTGPERTARRGLPRRGRVRGH